ncbi:hypothetical protein [Sphingomonas sp. SORGH_AS_0879]|uniref:hypothetical protein n=1 Tax=Sphingomonas sp. SORGH_AS_0879 TaxID=3041790 RepID=UPI00277FAB5F|nr:hypothetical protein [Sphingomonas sp. SORGH_AS_0879]MDQ1232334.1 hypothetical protein [Sphingomonas sp. SORGH_AS_0879]
MDDHYDAGVDAEPAGIDDRLRRIRDELALVESLVRSENEARIAPADIGRVVRSAREGIGRFFDASLFADPAFDMLLFVFLEEEAGRPVETSACYRASGVPRTTAVRWINMLVSLGMFESAPHPTDRRLALLSLSEQTREGVRQWLTSLRPLIERMTLRDQPRAAL